MTPRERSNANLKPFKKGESGNAGGRPKKHPISQRYAIIAETKLPEKIRRPLGLPEGSTYGDAIAIGQAIQAIKHAQSAKEFREGIEGKATTRVELVGPGDSGEHTVKLSSADTAEVLRSIFGLGEPAKNRDAEPGNPGADPK